MHFGRNCVTLTRNISFKNQKLFRSDSSMKKTILLLFCLTIAVTVLQSCKTLGGFNSHECQAQKTDNH